MSARLGPLLVDAMTAYTSFRRRGTARKKVDEIDERAALEGGKGGGAYVPFKDTNIPEASGREGGSWFQQYCITPHSSFVSCGCSGCGGRLPLIISNIAAVDGWGL